MKFRRFKDVYDKYLKIINNGGKASYRYIQEENMYSLIIFKERGE